MHAERVNAGAMKVLVTGGAGYIGSHTCVELVQAGFEPVVVDNLCNSSKTALERVGQITGKPLEFIDLDLRDGAALTQLFARHSFGAVIHFAGLKAVGESVTEPLRYYENNLLSTLTLLECMRAANVRKLVFSSSATVYGWPARNPIDESFPLQATNPYGRTKLFIEEMLRDLAKAEPGWDLSILRYFNPVGAHPSGLIGEDPRGVPNNLMPYVMQTAVGLRPSLTIHGGDYSTKDGTGVRDYLHVVDLALGHLAALRHHVDGAREFNLGTGQGHSVLEVVQAVRRATGRELPYTIGPRRSGDVAECFANAARAHQELGWRATRTLDDMCRDAWNWQSKNPQGYRAEE